MQKRQKVTRRAAAALAPMLIIAGLSLPLTGGTGPVASASGATCGTLPVSATHYSHVIWVWMENHSYDTIIGSSKAPYINLLATECGLATNYHNISHPSLPEIRRCDVRSRLLGDHPIRHGLQPLATVQHASSQHLRAGRVVEGLRREHAVQLRLG